MQHCNCLCHIYPQREDGFISCSHVVEPCTPTGMRWLGVLHSYMRPWQGHSKGLIRPSWMRCGGRNIQWPEGAFSGCALGEKAQRSVKFQSVNEYSRFMPENQKLEPLTLNPIPLTLNQSSRLCLERRLRTTYFPRSSCDCEASVNFACDKRSAALTQGKQPLPRSLESGNYDGRMLAGWNLQGH